MTTILITGVGGPAGRSLVEQLDARRDGAEPLVLVGADMAEVHGSALALVERVPPATDLAYPLAMRELLGRLRPDLVIPTVQEELVPLAVYRELVADTTQAPPHVPLLPLGEGFPWSVPPIVVAHAGAVAIAADKLLTMWALAEAGVPTPRSMAASEFGSTPAALHAMGGPFVLKPRVSRGGRGVRVVEHTATLPWWRADQSLIVQEFASGTEYDAQVYRSPISGRTEVVVLEKTELREGRVGNAVAVRRLAPGEASDVTYVAERAVEALGLEGPVDIDIRRLESGVPVVLEVNARFGANSAHAPELLDAVMRDFAPELARVAD